MAVKRPLRIFPDPILRSPCKDANLRDPSLPGLIEMMTDIMKSQKHGIGIAAPQVGVAQRLAIVDVSSRIAGAAPMIMLNPEILQLKQEKLSREGCMSVPDYTAQIKRYEIVRVRWQDLESRWHEKTCEGIEAVCVQHEVDHLNGKLFLDQVVSLKRDLIPRPKRFR